MSSLKNLLEMLMVMNLLMNLIIINHTMHVNRKELANELSPDALHYRNVGRFINHGRS